MLWRHEELLPLQSIAVHVLAMVPNPQLSRLELSDEVTEILATSVQLSVAVATPATPKAQLNVMLAGHVMVGAALSCKVMVWMQVDELLLQSTAFQVLWIVPNPQLSRVVLSDEVMVIALLAVQLSVAVAVPASPVVQSKNAAGGQVITGLVLSLIMMVCVAILLLPQASVALKVRITEPAHSVPLKEPSLQVTTGTPQLSLAVALSGLHAGRSE